MSTKKTTAAEHLRLKNRARDAWTIFMGLHPKDPLGYQPWWVRSEWLGEIAVHIFRPGLWRWSTKWKEIQRVLLGKYWITAKVCKKPHRYTHKAVMRERINVGYETGDTQLITSIVTPL